MLILKIGSSGNHDHNAHNFLLHSHHPKTSKSVIKQFSVILDSVYFWLWMIRIFLSCAAPACILAHTALHRGGFSILP